MKELAAQLVAKLEQRGETLATAESLTGGLLAATVVDMPGASAVYRGGAVTYATDLKVSLLEVDSSQLERTGPVDGEVAKQMARGAARLCGADWALATTGVAGPGPAEGKPAGTVFVGLLRPGSEPQSREFHFVADRNEIRFSAVMAALAWIIDEL